MPQLQWFIPALALLPCGWFAAAWHYKRKLLTLQHQVHAERRTAAEHAQQARRQIGQLQAELAARPPLPTAERDRAVVSDPSGTPGLARAGAGSDLGFAATAILSDGFPQTVLVRPPPRR